MPGKEDPPSVSSRISALPRPEASRLSGSPDEKAPPGNKPALLPLSKYEELLEALPLPNADARVVLAGARLGLLHETLAAVIIRSGRLPPVLLPSEGDEPRILQLRRYYRGARGSDDMHSAVFASLSAFMYWDCHWNRRRVEKVRASLLRLEDARLHRWTGGGLHKTPNAFDLWQWTEETRREHEQWCQGHFLNQEGVLAVSTVMEDSMRVLFLSRFEPEFLRCQEGAQPLWKTEDSWRMQSIFARKDMLFHVYGTQGGDQLCTALRALWEANGDVGPALMMASEVVVTGEGWNPCEVKLPVATREEGRIASLLKSTNRMLGKTFGTSLRAPLVLRPPREKYVSARTKAGVHLFEHSPDAPPVLDLNAKEPQEPVDLRPIAPLVFDAFKSSGPVNWFTRAAPKLAMLGDGDCSFSRAMISMGHSPRVSSTKRVKGPIRRRCRHRCIDATRLHQNHVVLMMVLDYEIHCFAWNFPEADNSGDGDKGEAKENESLILSLFYSLRMLMAKLYDLDEEGESLLVLQQPVMLGLSLHDDQFSRWSVLRSAQRVGWRLKGWCPFHHEDFPGYLPRMNNGRPIALKAARFYLFQYADRYSHNAGVS